MFARFCNDKMKTDEMNRVKWRSDEKCTVLIVTPEGNWPVERQVNM
jgi:hypothetical protein